MTFSAFQHQKYLSLETFRKNGQGVKTPVWFAQEGDALFVWTEASSGKAKRIRRDGTVRIAPSTGAGEVLGEWMEARAQVDDSPEALRNIQALMRKKYGVAFDLFGLLGRLRKAKHTSVRIWAR
ncbi:MAG: PPOX class F420-dependent oxidoreductase [Chloroflexi bacterium]|nr:PPOX class F420-dependent oxidoreductase [Chloroflexota bacterium]